MARRGGLVGLAKDWGLALGITLAIFIGWSWLTHVDLVESGPAPDFTLADSDGTPVTLSDNLGRPVVLVFWATWCGPCLAEIPELNAFHDAHPEVELLGINVDEARTVDRVQATMRRHQIDYPVLFDHSGAASDAYGVSSLPTTVVVDPEGTIRHASVGTHTRGGLARLVEGL